ncbi:hypothetical protein QP162_06825 [Sphingomonas aurantiaca]
MRPDVAKVSAAMQEQDAVGAGIAKGIEVKVVPGRDVARIAPRYLPQQGEFAQPDRAVADIRMVRKV